ncbi:hypothetical protein BpHYR1_009435 [Brachionus plicatilis]|uniref:Uncharacterized protein n=1 Tax=Brachionus plicatilis TaxID=10195 RepID=A0A3M7R606_BRAPC|nr:hypothetical protein BpHYR1_009435 [Brachionus plicatilis]
MNFFNGCIRCGFNLINFLRTTLRVLGFYRNNFGRTSLKKVISVFFNDCFGANYGKNVPNLNK